MRGAYKAMDRCFSCWVMRRNTDPLRGSDSPRVGGRCFCRLGVDRPRCQKLSGLRVGPTRYRAQLYRSELHGHVADNVSRARPYHRNERCWVSSRGEQGRGEREGSETKQQEGTTSRRQPCSYPRLGPGERNRVKDATVTVASIPGH